MSFALFSAIFKLIWNVCMYCILCRIRRLFVLFSSRFVYSLILSVAPCFVCLLFQYANGTILHAIVFHVILILLCYTEMFVTFRSKKLRALFKLFGIVLNCVKFFVYSLFNVHFTNCIRLITICDSRCRWCFDGTVSSYEHTYRGQKPARKQQTIT